METALRRGQPLLPAALYYDSPSLQSRRTSGAAATPSFSSGSFAAFSAKEGAAKQPPAVWKARSAGFASGCIAAIAAGCVTHPIDLVKVRLQISQAAAANAAGPRPGILSVTRGVVASEGVVGLYAGLTGSVLRQVILVGTRLGFYDAMKNQFADPSGQLPFEKAVACGAVAGAAAAVIGNPADMVMVRMQADGSLPPEQRRNYRHAGDALARIVRQEGLLALWRGTQSTVSRAMIVTSAQMAFYDKSKQLLIEVFGLSDAPSTHSLASLVAGGVAAVASNPFDVAKTRLQNMKPLPGGAGFPYRGMLHCIFTTSRSEGFLALYKGLLATWSRQAPLNTVRFVVLEQMKKIL